MPAAALRKQFESVLGGPWTGSPVRSPECVRSGVPDIDAATGELPLRQRLHRLSHRSRRGVRPHRCWWTVKAVACPHACRWRLSSGSKSLAALVCWNCYGTPDWKNKERHAVCAEAGGPVSENAPHCANHRAPGPHDPRRGIAADSEGSFQPSRSLRLRTAKAVRRIFADAVLARALRAGRCMG